jgi:two-component system, OmpR family, heavy metal sensor histidine kinase CusS
VYNRLILSMPSPLAVPVPEIATRAAEDEHSRVLSAGTGFRLLAACVFLAFALVCLAWSGRATCKVGLPAALGYTLFAGAIFALRRRKLLGRVAPVLVALDLGFVYGALRYAIAAYAGIGQLLAGLGLGLFAIIVALSGLSLRKCYTLLAALAGIIAEGLLLRQVGVSFPHILLAAGVLGLAARVAFIVAEGATRLVSETAGVESARHQLASTRAEYEQLSRLQRDKDSLVQLIVHDMRAPLSAATLSLEFLTRELIRQRASRDMLEASEDALTSATNVANMITQILDTTKLEEGRITLNLEQVPVRDLLEAARRQCLSRAQTKSVHIDVDAPDSVYLTADRRLFPRLLDNLMSNALRYTPAGGHILLVAAESGSELVLSVHNTGEPVLSADREKIFNKFQQGDKETRRMFGWGLGLYFCRLVAEAHSGHIAVEDVVGWPTSFVIRLPPGKRAGS